MLGFFTPDLVFSLAMLAVGALIFGGVRSIRRKGEQKRGWLMITAAVVLLGNVLIIAWPA